MTFPEFDDFQDKLLDEVVTMKNTKGKEYANSDSRFANFDRLSARLNIKPTAVALVYLTKHMDAIESYISRGRTYSTETIRGRIVDAITYLTLIAGMIDDELEKEFAAAALSKPNGSKVPIIWQCHYCNDFRGLSQEDLRLHEEAHIRNKISKSKCPTP